MRQAAHIAARIMHVSSDHSGQLTEEGWGRRFGRPTTIEHLKNSSF